MGTMESVEEFPRKAEKGEYDYNKIFQEKINQRILIRTATTIQNAEKKETKKSKSKKQIYSDNCLMINKIETQNENEVNQNCIRCISKLKECPICYEEFPEEELDDHVSIHYIHKKRRNQQSQKDLNNISGILNIINGEPNNDSNSPSSENEGSNTNSSSRSRTVSHSNIRALNGQNNAGQENIINIEDLIEHDFLDNEMVRGIRRRRRRRRTNNLTLINKERLEERKSILEKMNLNKLHKVDTLDEDLKKCLICLEKFSNGDEVYHLPCVHIFHKKCICKWVIRMDTCPICKYNIHDYK